MEGHTCQCHCDTTWSDSQDDVQDGILGPQDAED